jgi:nitrogen fixation NifU-like protein
MSDELNELYQEVILDHSRRPRNFGKPTDANRSAEGNNPLCGDHSGCAISKASASIMTDQLKGKTVAEAKKLFQRYQEMITKGDFDEEELGKLCAFAGVHHFPMRVKCAVLPWHAMLASLQGDAKAVSTEEHASA